MTDANERAGDDAAEPQQDDEGVRSAHRGQKHGALRPLASMSKPTQKASLLKTLALLCVFLLGYLPASFADTATATRVVVVGGGLAGLTTAYELQKRGIVAQIIEASDVFGWRVATARYPGGLPAEYGLQEMWGDNPALGMARELGVALAKGVTGGAVRALQDISFAEWIEREKLPYKASELVRLTLECELAAPWDRFSALAGLLEFGIFPRAARSIITSAAGISV